MVASPLEFPCDYPLKVMGRHTAEFRAQVLAVLAEGAGVSPALRVEERLSRDGSFVSLTCIVRVESRAELDLLYRRLHATGLVLYSL
jgi:putative lipoic acid-binding regulatory protein